MDKETDRYKIVPDPNGGWPTFMRKTDGGWVALDVSALHVHDARVGPRPATEAEACRIFVDPDFQDLLDTLFSGGENDVVPEPEPPEDREVIVREIGDISEEHESDLTWSSLWGTDREEGGGE